MEQTNTYTPIINRPLFADISNYKKPTSKDDKVPKLTLNISSVNENSSYTSSRPLTSRDSNCINGVSRIQRNDRLQQSTGNSSFRAVHPVRRAARQYTEGMSGNLMHPGSICLESQDLSGLSTPTHNKSGYSRSLRTSRINISLQSSQVGSNFRNQSENMRLGTLQKYKQRQKLNYRQALGSLSKQIKNTLRGTFSSNNCSENGSNSCNVEQYLLNSTKEQNYNLVPKTGFQQCQSQEGYTRYEKAPFFLTNSSISSRIKRPKFIDFKKFDHIETKENKENYYEDKPLVTSRFGRIQYQKQKSNLGSSSVTSFNSTKEKLLKSSSVLQPLTPKLRTARKYDSLIEMKSDKKNQSSFFKNQNSSYLKESSSSYKNESSSSYKNESSSFHKNESSSFYKNEQSSSYKNDNPLASTSSVKTPSNFYTPKSSFLPISSVVQSKQLQSLSISSREENLLSNEISLSDFHLGSMKGEGRFGKFYPAIHKKTGMLVGIKQIKKQALKSMLQQFIQQLKIQSYIDHPNIVKLYGYFTQKENFYIILQYMEEGSLFSFMKRSKLKKIPQQEASTKLKQVCSAVEYLHENQIIHRDIKPQNIVMTCDVCKLCDFGWAVYTSTRRKTYCGTLDYVCPEIIQGASYDSCVDIWALGVLAFEMIVGKAPFYNISRKQTMKKIVECNFELPKQLSSQAKEFISIALSKNPNERQSMSILANHQFLN